MWDGCENLGRGARGERATVLGSEISPSSVNRVQVKVRGLLSSKAERKTKKGQVSHHLCEFPRQYQDPRWEGGVRSLAPKGTHPGLAGTGGWVLGPFSEVGSQ